MHRAVHSGCAACDAPVAMATPCSLHETPLAVMYNLFYTLQVQGVAFFSIAVEQSCQQRPQKATHYTYAVTTDVFGLRTLQHSSFQTDFACRQQLKPTSKCSHAFGKRLKDLPCCLR